VAALRGLDVISDRDAEGLVRLRRSAEGRAVPLLGLFSSTDSDLYEVAPRANVASSFTILKGAMIDETHTVLCCLGTCSIEA
jgi:hypothetical protein